jgi:hypothetical protein
MPRPEKMTEIDRALDEVMKYDARRRSQARRLIPEELIEAMDYYVRWGLASNRGRALIELARPMAHEVVAKVREVGTKSVRDIVAGAGLLEEEPEPPPPCKSSTRQKSRRSSHGTGSS